MSAGAFFNINNNEGATFNVTTISSSATTFDPVVTVNGFKTVRWDYGDGIAEAGNSLSHTYADSGTSKTARMSISRYDDIAQITLNSDSIIGDINLSNFNKCTRFRFNSNAGLSGVTFPTTAAAINHTNFLFCNIIGDVDLTTMSNISGLVSFGYSTSLTGVTFSAESANSFTTITLNNCDIYGRIDLSGYTSVGGTLNYSFNPNLTGATFGNWSNNFNTFNISSTGIANPLQLSGLTGLGGLVNLGGINSPSIEFPISSNNITSFTSSGNDNIIDLNISGLTGMGGPMIIGNCLLLTGVTMPQSSNSITTLTFNTTPSIKDIDFSPLSGMGGLVLGHTCSSLSGVTFPHVSNPFSTIHFYDDNFSDYVNFTPLSSATNNDVNIRFDGNAIPTAGINQILFDLDSFGWTGGSLSLQSGTNGAPDGSTGGFDGTGATASLIAKSWTVSTN